MQNMRVGVLLGGLGHEREISLRSGEAVAEALSSRGYQVVKIYVDRDVDQVLRQNPVDVAFIALHGPYGEDGCIQGLLEMMGIPYTGSGVLASALAMDKVKSKELFRLHNVPTPPYYVAQADEVNALADIHGSFGFPVFVKPRRAGSSVGGGIATDLPELAERVAEASAYDSSVLVERFIRGKEVQVGLMDGRAMGAIEITFEGRFLDYRSKYQPGLSQHHFPARLSPTRYQGVLHIAERAASCLGTEGAVRVDMLVTEGENEYVLEVNTLPGLTKLSLLPEIAEGSGMDFGDLCEAILQRARLGAHQPASPAARSVATGQPLVATRGA